MSAVAKKWPQITPSRKMVVSKLECAEAHINAAVRLYLGNAHLVPVFTLANAAREVVETLGHKAGMQTFNDEMASVLMKPKFTRGILKASGRLPIFSSTRTRTPTLLWRLARRLS
jgi:hypothetical protein